MISARSHLIDSDTRKSCPNVLKLVVVINLGFAIEQNRRLDSEVSVPCKLLVDALDSDMAAVYVAHAQRGTSTCTRWRSIGRKQDLNEDGAEVRAIGGCVVNIVKAHPQSGRIERLRCGTLSTSPTRPGAAVSTGEVVSISASSAAVYLRGAVSI